LLRLSREEGRYFTLHHRKRRREQQRIVQRVHELTVCCKVSRIAADLHKREFREQPLTEDDSSLSGKRAQLSTRPSRCREGQDGVAAICSGHFAVVEATIIGLTPEGRTTVELMDMNNPDRVLLRDVLLRRGWRHMKLARARKS
jgi:hypothetical protein